MNNRIKEQWGLVRHAEVCTTLCLYAVKAGIADEAADCARQAAEYVFAAYPNLRVVQ